ncbi:MAG: hypothetical protein DWB56_02980 [Candidatus Jettenia sp.]|uniref:Transposase IS200-like domain-containing protein n=1 Tax=Candidatus Jettenia caeni TaxID=247490 RepID=I3ING1_9BACT|nr:transposase [Candidatus Jettenia sp. AMX1]MBC6927921.1 hypothetical protein [Candidatus Jettenia sp.]NUN21853.1 transposase [Candidatus Jettenia caeni]KAA0248242.1 MAG: hypothetical protein EDM77_13115 [Candidatus Jettenia sp. AMX1]MCE7879524.1 hypothetical protein [Candidatus Jettenia sp. AMX1]MDL1937852.1 hypothetical protein [Candidatus Jettenia sp. AMX1]
MRSRYKHFHDSSPYFITCTTVNWIPIFTTPYMFEIAAESLRFLRSDGLFKLYAYVILENHLHMIAASEELSKNIGRFKSYTARRIIDSALLGKITWLLNQLQEEKKSFKRYRTHQLWQEGFHPQRIQSEAMMRQKIEYIHYNPVRSGYVDDPVSWIYSSARNFINNDNSILELDPIIW